MAVADTDIELYCAASMPESDSGTSGGGIDLTTKAALTARMASTSALEVVSDNAGDTMNITVTGRLASGDISSDTVALNGTTAVAVTGTFERFLKAVCASAPAGTITVRLTGAGATVCTFGGNGVQTGIRTVFYAAESSSSAAKTLYEKVFFKNEHATTTVSAAKVLATVDPTGPSDFDVAVDDAVNGTLSTTGRTVAPTPAPASGYQEPNTEIDVPGNALAAGSQIGVWMRMQLSAGNVALKSNTSLRLKGASV